MAAHSSGPLTVFGSPGFEAAQVGALGVAALGDERERAMVLDRIGLGVGERGPHADEQQRAVGPDPADPSLHRDPVVVRHEGVGQVDGDRATGRAQAEGRGAGDGEAVGGCREGPVAERHRVAAGHQREPEEVAALRQDLGDRPPLARGHGPVMLQPRLDQPAPDGAHPVAVERRGDPDGVRRGRRRPGAVRGGTHAVGGGRVGHGRRRRRHPARGTGIGGTGIGGRRRPPDRPAAGRFRKMAGAMAITIIRRIAQTVRRSMSSDHAVRGRDRSHPDETGDTGRDAERPASSRARHRSG